MVREMQLERRDTGQCALRCADFGREVGQCHEVIAEDGSGVSELVSSQLHTVARVTRKPDHNSAEGDEFFTHYEAFFVPGRAARNRRRRR